MYSVQKIKCKIENKVNMLQHRSLQEKLDTSIRPKTIYLQISTMKVLLFVYANFRGSNKLPVIVGSLYSWFHNWQQLILWKFCIWLDILVLMKCEIHENRHSTKYNTFTIFINLSCVWILKTYISSVIRSLYGCILSKSNIKKWSILNLPRTALTKPDYMFKNMALKYVFLTLSLLN